MTSGPLTLGEFRQWISSTRCPIIPILATPQAQADLERALHKNSTPFSGSVPNNSGSRSAAQSRGTAPGFSSLFQPFASLPAVYESLSQRTNAILQEEAGLDKIEFSCPRNVTIRSAEQRSRTLDYFPVRFKEAEDCRPVSPSEADANLLNSLSMTSPSIEAICISHRLHPFSARALESPYVEDNSKCRLLDSSPKVNTFAPSSKYPHSRIRVTNTVRHCEPRPIPPPAIPTEADIYDSTFLTVPLDSSAVSDAAAVRTLWFEAWVQELCRSLDFSDHECLCQPVALILVASTREHDPVAAFEELGHCGKSDASVPPFIQQLLESSTVRCYVLVHSMEPAKPHEGASSSFGVQESTRDDRMVTHAMNSVKSAFPPGSCHLVMLKSEEWSVNVPPAANEQEVFAAFMSCHHAILRAVTHTIIQNTIVPTIERLVKHLADHLSQHRKGIRSQIRGLWARKSKQTNSTSSNMVVAAANLAESALDHTALFLWGDKANDDITKKGSVSRNSSGTAQQVAPLEMRGRFFADLCFFLGDYTQAAAAYRVTVSEFKHNKSIKCLAGAMEMLGVVTVLSKGSRNDAEQCFAQALSSYVDTDLLRLALRSQLIAARALLAACPSLAPEIAGRLEALCCEVMSKEVMGADVDTDEAKNTWNRANAARSALLLEQAAVCYSIAGERFSRKMCFYNVLAGHAFVKCGLVPAHPSLWTWDDVLGSGRPLGLSFCYVYHRKHLERRFRAHGLRCYSIVANHVSNGGWRFMVDYALFSVARQSHGLALTSDSLLAFIHLLNNVALHSMSGTKQNTRLFSMSKLKTQPYRYALTNIGNKAAIPLNRETTYFREFLFVFKWWNDQMRQMITKFEVNVHCQQRCLDALESLRFELAVPYVTESDETVSDPTVAVLSSMNTSPELNSTYESECYENQFGSTDDGTTLLGHTSMIFLADCLGTSLSLADERELGHLTSHLSRGVKFRQAASLNVMTDTDFLRSTAVNSRIVVEIPLSNPLSVPLECKNMRLYGKLVELGGNNPGGEGERVRSLADDEVEDPFIFDVDQSVVEFVPQSVKLTPSDTIMVKCEVVPKRPGQLIILGLCWELYSIARIFKPLRLFGKKKCEKEIIAAGMMAEVGPVARCRTRVEQSDTSPCTSPAVKVGSNLSVPLSGQQCCATTSKSVLPSPPRAGVVSRASLVFDLLEHTPVEMELSAVASENLSRPISGPLLLKQALLVSQLTGDALTRYRRAVQYVPDKRLNLRVAGLLPRVVCEVVGWPDDALLHGQIHEICLRVSNVGEAVVSSLRIAVSPREAAFFKVNLLLDNLSDDENPAPDTHVYIRNDLLQVGRHVDIPMLLRGSNVGKQRVHFCIMAEHLSVETGQTSAINMMLSERSTVANDDSSHFRADALFHNSSSLSSIMTVPGVIRERKWILLERTVTVVPCLNATIGHHASWRSPGLYVTICQLGRARPSHVPVQNASVVWTNSPFSLLQNPHIQLVVTQVDALLPFSPGMQRAPFSRSGFSSVCQGSQGVRFLPIPLTPCLLTSDPTEIPFDNFIQLFYTCNPYPDVGVADPPQPTIPLPIDTDPVSSAQNPLIRVISVVRTISLERAELNEAVKIARASLTRLGNDGNLQRICRKKREVELLLSSASVSTLKCGKNSLKITGNIPPIESDEVVCRTGPVMDYCIRWEMRSRANGATLVSGEHFISRVPLFTAVASCPLKFQLHPAVRNITSGLVGQAGDHRSGENIQLATPLPRTLHLPRMLHNIRLSLHNISQTAFLRVAVETDSEASCRGLTIHQQGPVAKRIGTGTALYLHETSKLHRQWMLHIKNVINTAVRSKDAGEFFGAAANRFPASDVFWVGPTSFVLKVLKPGELFCTSLSLLCLTPGVFNLNKFRFIVKTLDDGVAETEERIFAFPFESLIRVHPPTINQ